MSCARMPGRTEPTWAKCVRLRQQLAVGTLLLAWGLAISATGTSVAGGSSPVLGAQEDWDLEMGEAVQAVSGVMMKCPEGFIETWNQAEKKLPLRKYVCAAVLSNSEQAKLLFELWIQRKKLENPGMVVMPWHYTEVAPGLSSLVRSWSPGSKGGKRQMYSVQFMEKNGIKGVFMVVYLVDLSAVPSE